MFQEGENTSSKSVQLDYNSLKVLLKVLFQGRGFITKIITGVITIKACNGVTEKCADNIHFTDAAKAYLQILYSFYSQELMTSPNNHSTEIRKALIASL